MKVCKQFTLSIYLFIYCLYCLLTTNQVAANDYSTKTYEAFYVASTKKTMGYYIALIAKKGTTLAPKKALIVIHGYLHDVNKTFNTALLAANQAKQNNILIIAPMFKVGPEYAKQCQTDNDMEPTQLDLVRNCHLWMQGGLAV